MEWYARRPRIVNKIHAVVRPCETATLIAETFWRAASLTLREDDAAFIRNFYPAPSSYTFIKRLIHPAFEIVALNQRPAVFSLHRATRSPENKNGAVATCDSDSPTRLTFQTTPAGALKMCRLDNPHLSAPRTSPQRRG